MTDALLADFYTSSKKLYKQVVECQNAKAIVELKKKTNELNKEVQEFIGEIPSYDRKRVVESVESLFKYVELKIVQLDESQRFSFEGSPIPNPDYKKRDSTRKEDHDTQDNTDVSLKTKGGVYRDQVRVKVTIGEEGVDKTGRGHLLVTNTVYSVVQCKQASSIHIRGGKMSVFRLVVDGPVFVHDLDRVVLVLQCHQVRLHNVRRSVIMVSKTADNRMIIEDCSGLAISSLESGPLVEVDDFNWPTKAVVSPHYKAAEPVDISWIDDVDDGPLSEDTIDKLKSIVPLDTTE
ncbi:hypothetical protein G9P44_000207 [Scheffersomyces stipitis]|nr:hypothetical protein G9P44_000207 [Scheffersomyces stipitis]